MKQKRFLISLVAYFNLIQPLFGAEVCSPVNLSDILLNGGAPNYASLYTDNTFLPTPEPEPTTMKEYNEADGSYTIKDAEGNIIGYEGKRIYTIEEANLVAKPTGNTVRIKYQ